MKTRYSEPTTFGQVRIPESIYRELSILLLDPLTGRIRYGALQDLLLRLIVEWINKQRKPGA